jgi:hypothetical protein
MNIPSSFCTIATETCSNELIGLLLSLSIHHRDANILCYVDTKTKNIIENITPKIRLNIIFVEKLNKYSNMNRQQMEHAGIWSDFQMEKANVIKDALEIYSDTLFLDSDILILDKIDCINNEKDIGVSPHYIRKSDTDKYGYYNGGVLWTKNKNICNDWIEFTKTSRYFDQASIEDLAKKYSFFEFGENYNFSWWRVMQSEQSPNDIIKNITISNNKLHYKRKPLKFVHTHFNQQGIYHNFNTIIKMFLTSCKSYRELAIIDRIVNDKWNIIIPKQPMGYPWNHTNDSFRELALLLRRNNTDVGIEYSPQHVHVYLSPNILLYDRDTLLWFDENTGKQSSIVYLGNCDINTDKKLLENKFNVLVKPWIYWVRHPIILEGLLSKGLGTLSYDERQFNTIFIGNVENNVQGTYRLNQNWDKYIDEYHCTSGVGGAKFNQKEYLEKNSQARFGLCLRGFGVKCHREIELMAVGTVPLITPHVCIDSFKSPPIEGVHYLRVNTSEDIPNVINNISKDKWIEMSNACKKWYMDNCHSTALWNNLINDILYE